MTKMTKAAAVKEARRRFGPRGDVRLNRRVTWTESDRVSARADLAALRAAKPVRSINWTLQTDAEKRAYVAAFRAFRAREEYLMGVALSHRYDVGENMSIVAGFSAFGVHGSGDTYEDAFADVDRKNERRRLASAAK
jgi:hypothetical protein